MADWNPVGLLPAGIVADKSLLDSLNADESYSLFAVGLDVGASPTVARAVSVGFAAAVLLGAWVLGRRGKDASSFALTIAAAIGSAAGPVR